MRQHPDLKSQSYCTYQAGRGNPNAKKATHFVSWGLSSLMFALLAGLETWLEESGLDPVTTYFWICDFCIRQLEGKMEGVRRLGAVVQRMEMTVMFLEPWDKMVATFEGERLNCLSRMWCVRGGGRACSSCVRA